MRHYEYAKYSLIRRLYFKQMSNEFIASQVEISPRKVKSIITNKKLVKKRDRYYRFLINHAYANNEQISDLAKRTGIKATCFGRIKRLFNIKTKRFLVPNKRITKDVELAIIEAYELGFSGQQVAEQFGYKTSKTAEDILKKYKKSVRPARMQHQLDYNYFKQIDSHDKAYILGLLYTDGYIYKNYEGFCIQLTESDGYLLERIASKIGKSATVIKINCAGKRQKMPNVKDMVRLGVYSKILAEQVKELGVIRNKTYHLEITKNLPTEFNYSFIRGVIDGDGTVGIYNNKITCQIAMKSLTFANDICNLKFDENLKYYHTCNNMFRVYVMGGGDAVARFLSKMYKHKSDLYLERKYAKVQDRIC